jgi:hypothetical protein
LAAEYAGQPVLFLEQHASHPLGDRQNRFWAAYQGGTSATLPLVIVDSGHGVSNGPVQYYAVYKALVEAELQRPAQAEITATAKRAGDHLEFTVQVTNRSTTTLSSELNDAAVHVIVWEDIRVGLTDRTVRAAASTPASEPLAPDATLSFALATGDLSGVEWTNLHAIALVDYRPGGHSGAYDMLQAALVSGVPPARPGLRNHLYLPLARRAVPAGAPTGINGRVTFHGAAASGLRLELILADGSSASVIAGTPSDAAGRYDFNGVPALAAGRQYYVLYTNPPDSPNPGAGCLLSWVANRITSYDAGTTFAGGDFDVADVPLVSPATQASVALPAQFCWQPRGIAGDTYQLQVYNVALQSGATHGYRGPDSCVTIASLPGGWSSGNYLWSVVVYQGDPVEGLPANFGTTYNVWPVTISVSQSGAGASSTGADAWQSDCSISRRP